jgi:hypothetical protein
MAEALVIDSLAVPVLVDTWQETIYIPGSRRRAERGNLRSVRLGCPLSKFTGTGYYATRVEADVLRALLTTYGDHVVSGWLPGRGVVCETDCGPIEPVDHRPPGVDPTAQWSVAFTLHQTKCGEVDEEVPEEPAGIMLVTGLTGSTSTTRIKSALEEAGHTVTIVDHDEFSTGFTPFTPYEIIVTSEVSRNSSKGAKIREVLQSGRGWVNMPDFWADGTTIQPLLYFVGLHSNTSYLSRFINGRNVGIIDEDHYITELHIGQVQVLEDDDERITQVLNSPVLGSILAIGDPFSANHAGKAAIIAYETGTVYLTEPVEATLARVAFVGYAPDDTTLTNDGKILLQRAVAWVLAGS